jgi:hypothetical protein
MKTGLMAVALVAALGSVSFAASASSLKYDGNELLQQCQQYIKAMDGDRSADLDAATYCEGYVAGVTNTVSFYRGTLKNEDKFCIEDSVTNSQVIRVVVKFLNDNPRHLNKDKMVLTWAALHNAFPCK